MLPIFSKGLPSCSVTKKLTFLKFFKNTQKYKQKFPSPQKKGGGGKDVLWVQLLGPLLPEITLLFQRMPIKEFIKIHR